MNRNGLCERLHTSHGLRRHSMSLCVEVATGAPVDSATLPQGAAILARA